MNDEKSFILGQKNSKNPSKPATADLADQLLT